MRSVGISPPLLPLRFPTTHKKWIAPNASPSASPPIFGGQGETLGLAALPTILNAHSAPSITQRVSHLLMLMLPHSTNQRKGGDSVRQLTAHEITACLALRDATGHRCEPVKEPSVGSTFHHSPSTQPSRRAMSGFRSGQFGEYRLGNRLRRSAEGSPLTSTSRPAARPTTLRVRRSPQACHVRMARPRSGAPGFLHHLADRSQPQRSQRRRRCDRDRSECFCKPSHNLRICHLCQMAMNLPLLRTRSSTRPRSLVGIPDER